MQVPVVNAVGKRKCGPASWRIPWRALSDWEWVLVEDGEGTVWTETGAHPVSRGSLMLFSPGLCHRIDTSVEKPMRFSFVHFDAPDCLSLPLQRGEQSFAAQLRAKTPVMEIKAFGSFVRLVERFHQAQNRIGASRVLLLGALQLEWLVLMRDELSQKPSGFTAWRRLEKLRAAIQTNPEADWRLPTMAACCGVCPDTLSRDVMACTGERPTIVRDRIRLEEAKRLLDETSLTVQEILARCGWEDPFYGSRRFRQLCGCTPTGWREGENRCP